MRKTKLSLDTLQVDTFEPAPETGGLLAIYPWGPPTDNWAYSCGYDISCQLYNCDS